MVEIDVAYDGQLACTAVHVPSGSKLITDAPRDNQGLGRTFSPTDLLATSLATCILTTMAISLKKHGLELGAARAKVVKEMTATPPRRVAKLTVQIALPASTPEDRRAALEAAAHACPVHKSLHPDVQMPIVIVYE